MSICMCGTLADCGKKNECCRFKKQPHEFYQPWADMYEILYEKQNEGCIHFIPIKEGDNMYISPKNDNVILQAAEAQNNGNHIRAAALFQDAGNQLRNPEEKKLLWGLADKARKTHYSD